MTVRKNSWPDAQSEEFNQRLEAAAEAVELEAERDALRSSRKPSKRGAGGHTSQRRERYQD